MYAEFTWPINDLHIHAGKNFFTGPFLKGFQNPHVLLIFEVSKFAGYLNNFAIKISNYYENLKRFAIY